MKVSIPKGFRDFSPIVMAKRNYIFNTIEKYFKLYGFEQIETPTMENRSTLTGKYGEEGDRLIFSVLNSGDFLSKTEEKFLENKESKKVVSSISDKALRYDLTVPFARYVVQHQNEITFPFKRFQIQAVWRADRPQRGRYREFYQCDADIIGSDSLLNEIELIKLFDSVLSELGLNDFSIKLNNRKVLSAIAEKIGKADKLIELTVALDKLDKIGVEKVIEELKQRAFTEEDIEKIKPLFSIGGNSSEIIESLKDYLKESEIGREGIEELSYLVNEINNLGLKTAKLEIDVTLARGLDYYTGSIIEVVSNEVAIGSIGGGGRYADLTSIFGLKDMSGVGVSFGADRIYDVMEELDVFPKNLNQSVEVFVANFGGEEEQFATTVLYKLREEGIKAEMYPQNAKMKKQMTYANRKNIPFVLLVGEEERKSGKLTLKIMETGEQKVLEIDALVKELLND